MTAKQIENDMKQFAGGSFITPGKLARYLGQKNTTRVKEKYLSGLPTIEGTKAYFIPEVADKVHQQITWEDC